MRLFGGGGAKREERAFDRVVVLGEDGSAERTLTPAEFHTLGLDERVRLILGKRLRFYAGTREIPLKEALRDS
ncbi:MAG: hypothetical protein GXY23_01830 [Myxococcales bacterium]|nr:hypothetical protein [Myxococcales bacterium]